METINQAAVKQDLYDAVNGEWLKTAVIPDDHSSTGGFMDLVDAIEKTLMHDFDAMAAGTVTPDDPQLTCPLHTSPIPQDRQKYRLPSFA